MTDSQDNMGTMSVAEMLRRSREGMLRAMKEPPQPDIILCGPNECAHGVPCYLGMDIGANCRQCMDALK